MSSPFPKPQDHSKTLAPNPPNPLLSIQSHLNSLKSHLQSALQSFHSALSPSPQQSPAAGTPPWACLSLPGSTAAASGHRFDLAMATVDMEQRLAGVPVYALSNSAEEFVLVAGRRTGKNLGLFCFRREDAESLLEEMKGINVEMREGAKVVELALSKVCQLKVDGVAFRFVPDSSQVANAIWEKEKIGQKINGFSGVPVFQSRSLVLWSQKKRYRPFFFRKEDLDDSLSRASRQQSELNPSLRRGDMQVFVLEDIIKSLTERKASEWDDVVFIPPGFNLSTDLSQIAEG